MARSYVVYYETESHIGFTSVQYGEMGELKKMCRERGHKITAIEYLVDGKVIRVKRFERGRK